MNEKDRRRIRRRNNLTRIRENPTFRNRVKPGHDDQKIKHHKHWLEEQIDD